MSKQTSRKNAGKQDNEALKSLINDQTEARVKKEINISRTDSKAKSGPDSAAKKSAGQSKATSGSGIRKTPTMKETKAQLIKRMEKLLSELDKFEAKVEQKGLELESADKDRKKIESDLDKVSQEKINLEKELKNKEQDLKTALDKEKDFDIKKSELEKMKQQAEEQLSKKDEAIAAAEKVRNNLESRINSVESKTKEFSVKEADYQARIDEKDAVIYQLNQEKQAIKEDMEKMMQEADNQKKNNQAGQNQSEAVAWRDKADALWNGTAYDAPQKAIYYLNAALDLKPDWPEVFNDRGLARLDDYQLDDALEDFTTALTMKNDFAEAFHNRGVALLKGGKKFAATKDFQVAATHGIWLGMNAVQAPAKGCGLINRIKKLFGFGRRR
ncbi:MAG: hypothetical protein ABR542_09970 [Desulfonatronovibrio sp.]|nr:hypothetical protein [Desulfovibrionales bacterium]